MKMANNKKSLLAISVASVMLSGCFWDDPKFVAKYVSDQIDKDAVVKHLDKLEKRAVPTPDGKAMTRAAGTKGYKKSLKYIAKKLRKAGYKVTKQEFDFRSWQELGNTNVEVDGKTLLSSKDAGEGEVPDYATMSYSGSSNGTVTGDLVFITPDFRFDQPDYDDTDGCETTDFNGKDVAGKIAVIQRGGCSFNAKATNAQAAGAKGVLIFNQGNNDGRKSVVQGTLGRDSTVTIPTFGLRYDLGKQWYDALASGAISASMNVITMNQMVKTNNLLAETRHGDDDQVIMLGAHLDSVPEGPGINDNGSGSAGLLEYALILADIGVKPKNKIRFAWWAAEEAGLIGSNYYTEELFKPLLDEARKQIMEELGIDNPDDLTEEQQDMVEARYNELNNVKLYLNFDMIGSPNYIYGVMDGDLSDTKDSPDNAYTGDFTPPFGTSDIEAQFIEFFGNNGEKTVPQALSKRSDYAGFADWGVAFGGLFTGAEKLKSAEEVGDFGGDIDVAYDKCYHRACDDSTNVSHKALFMNTKALTYVTTYYAMSEELFPEPEATTQAAAKSARSFAISSEPTALKQTLRIGERLKAADSVSDHDHFHGDFDQDME
ncbi:putative Aminopeptidase Y (Arg Lys Leu preference) [Vibrio nigripulchritudo SO65]|uniref:M20/M25/M40 family metallo-hydrolase n=1 Tax=Vibrio nigripulchritudo TaxID=28173 RepID=UPI0003B1C09E|nr:M20/M25/M40 family metallo-hydrolase [Vibrio nigripulchritudo]CCN36606.1 putative Aminopeptidase Y (Arg Lys Leu preference) [Vibrio nigripulchritudo AM115]CCN44834.1 putative Aminopeptidase Y (Arg Lys Leu preference) [Vibrio nigripulchritudo FTn2]CCN67948.1 putative Aminopeptidase Y (Arg Lys Leu preference) [Vibrio nigripulchritudo POn4]CCN76602.1 putative Aminopeptidase Y (Arg Lys Leu preference) [Vibrio nigripulchritudo SO65]